MNQVMVYCIINQNNFTIEEMETIQEGVFKYMVWNTIDIQDTVNSKITETIEKSMPALFYNPAKEIPSLVKEQTNIEQYPQIREIREAITDETAMELSEEQLQEIQNIADTYEEEETSTEGEDVIYKSTKEHHQRKERS